MADFLLEIGLEEVPARMIAGAEAELGRRLVLLLGRERLIDLAGTNMWTDDSLKVNGKQVAKSYSTPRRLAIQVTGVASKQDDLNELVEGPPVTAAYKNGEPTAAAHAFAKKIGVPVEDLLKIQKAKGEYICARILRRGRTAAEILAAEFPKEVLGLYWAKNMYWRAGKPERFVRPVRWVVALLDSTIVPLEIAGIAAGDTSRGHRVLHGEAPVVLSNAKDYSEKLRAAFVIVDAAERRHSIRKALDAATRTVAGARWREDAALIETVVHLTEWPSVVLGDFEPEYLALPEEVLVTVMRDHQKYFAVESANGKLAPHFLAVLNTQVNNEGQAIIRHGNARVLRARFKDAQFFWDFDQKIPLTERVESLKSVTFQKELGSYYLKTSWNDGVAFKLHGALERKGFAAYSYAALTIAVGLAKADLTTELVKEFTELQGIIGGLYVKAQGLPGDLSKETIDKVGQAIYWQYMPASADDATPPTVEGQLLGLADRIQTIIAMFSIGNAPTGSKDPFALRRAANAIVKILAESEMPLTFSEVVESSTSKIDWDEYKASVASFLRERLHFYLKDVRGFGYDVVNAVLASGADDVRDAIARSEALTAARESTDFAAISAAFKRIRNILRQAEEKGFEIGSPKSNGLAPEAQQLYHAAAALAPKVAKLRLVRAYGEALALIATLRPTVDAFFDKVMVLDPDPAVRSANLALINNVLHSFSGIADFSEIVTA
jgi:glycyl-tRNA synthetase beta chain